MLAVLAAVAVGSAFYPALRNGFVWDDAIFFQAYPVDVYFASWFADGTEPFVLQPNYFRPLAYAVYCVDVILGGSDPAFSHGLNLLLHCLNTALVGVLAFGLLRANRHKVAAAVFAGLGALWYGLHPVMVEPVAWITGRFDLLVTLFLLLILALSLSGAGRFRYFLIGFLYLSALLTKEMAVSFVLVWPVWIWVLQRTATEAADRKGQLWRGWLALAAALLIALAWRYQARGQILFFPDSIAQSLAERAWLVIISATQFIRLALLPFGSTDPLHMQQDFNSGFIALTVLLLVLAAWALRKGEAAGMLLLAGMISLAPVSNLVPIPVPEGNYVSDRYLAWPLVFAALALAMLAAKSWARFRSRWVRAACACALAAWLLMSVAIIRVTLPLWKDDLTYWGWMHRLHPQALVVARNYSAALLNNGAAQQAGALLERALSANPGSAGLWQSLAAVYREQGRHAAAVAASEKSLELDPGDADTWHILAATYAASGDLARSELLLKQKVLALNPAMVSAHLNLLRVYVAGGRRDAAREHMARHPAIFTGRWHKAGADILAP